MPTVSTSITIAAPPSAVREVFLDWTNYEWSKAFLNKIEIKGKQDTSPANLQEGDMVKVTTPSMGFESTVQASLRLSIQGFSVYLIPR